MVHEIFDLGKGNLCRALTAFDIFGRRHICACGDNHANIYDFESERVLHVNFPQSNGNINFAGVVAPNISNTINPQISDLEQILLLNHTEHGLFGFSLYELVQNEEIKICRETLHTDSHRLSPVGTNRYKIKKDKLFFAGIDDDNLTVGEIRIEYADNKERLTIPFLDYIHISRKYNSNVFSINDDDNQNNRDEGKLKDEAVSCIEIDIDEPKAYVGTNKGRIFVCSLAYKPITDEPPDKESQNIDNAVLLYEEDPEYGIYNLHVVHDNLVNNIANDKKRGNKLRKVLAFNRKNSEEDNSNGRIEIISTLENTAEATTSFLYDNLAVNWFYYNGTDLYTVHSRRLITHDVQKDRATQKRNFNLEYSDKEDIVKADYTDRTAFGRKINCVRALILNNK